MCRFLPLVILLVAAVRAFAATTYTFAPLPMEEPETVLRQTKPMLDYLEQRTGLALRIDYSKDYAEILRKFQSGQVDFAYLGPLPYVALREAYAWAEPVVHFREKEGQASYTCSVVVSDAKLGMARLKGKRIALTQPLSTCGYLATDGLMRKAGFGLEQTRYRYLGTHEEVALAVARGEFDAGGLKTAIGKGYAHLGVRVLSTSDALPGFALIANRKSVRNADIEAIRHVLSNLRPKDSAADAAQVQSWGGNLRYGAVPASDVDYVALRALRTRAQIPVKGNF